MVVMGNIFSPMGLCEKNKTFSAVDSFFQRYLKRSIGYLVTDTVALQMN